MVESGVDHMTKSISMDKDQNQVTERILDLTLEIIYLLTGEDYKVVKKMSGDPLTPNICLREASPVTEPPTHRLTSERKEKILEVTKKIIDLLTGEVPIRCQDVSVYFSTEDWEHLEGYKDIMVENEPPLTSPDGSRKRNPPERCPRPLYSRDPTQEDHNYSLHDQGEKPKDIKVEIKEEEEETLVSGAQQSMEEGEMILKNEQKEFSLDIDTNGCFVSHSSEGDSVLPLGVKAEDDDITQHSPGVNLIINNINYKHSHSERSMNPSNPEESSDQSNTMTSDLHLGSRSAEKSTDPSNPEGSSLSDGGHPVESSLSPLDCEKSHTKNRAPPKQQSSPSAEQPYSCSECGRCYSKEQHLLVHQRSHTTEPPYSCSECGKFFTNKKKVLKHQKSHMRGNPYLCSDCGKYFIKKQHFLKHRRSHLLENPYSCSECGKCFTAKGSFLKHQRIHKETSGSFLNYQEETTQPDQEYPARERLPSNAVSRLHERHFPDLIPSTEADRSPQKRCRVCSKDGIRSDTRYYCPYCPSKPGLCIKDCFRLYHTSLRY